MLKCQVKPKLLQLNVCILWDKPLLLLYLLIFLHLDQKCYIRYPLVLWVGA